MMTEPGRESQSDPHVPSGRLIGYGEHRFCNPSAANAGGKCRSFRRIRTSETNCAQSGGCSRRTSAGRRAIKWPFTEPAISIVWPSRIRISFPLSASSRRLISSSDYLHASSDGLAVHHRRRYDACRVLHSADLPPSEVSDPQSDCIDTFRHIDSRHKLVVLFAIAARLTLGAVQGGTLCYDHRCLLRVR